MDDLDYSAGVLICGFLSMLGIPVLLITILGVDYLIPGMVIGITVFVISAIHVASGPDKQSTHRSGR